MSVRTTCLIVLVVVLFLVGGWMLGMDGMRRQEARNAALRDEGRKAARAGIPETACPYPDTWNDTGRREQWLKGWIEAREETVSP
jgi:ribosome modulation factor